MDNDISNPVTEYESNPQQLDYDAGLAPRARALDETLFFNGHSPDSRH